MDRKGIVGLIITVLLFGAWNFYYLRKTHEAEVAHQAMIEQQQREAAVNPQPEPVPPTTAGTAGSSSAPAKPAGEAAAPEQRAEQKETLSTSSAKYAFSNLGGGLSQVTLLNHFGENGQPVILNEFGTLPIGALADMPGQGAAAAYTVSADAAAGTVSFERTDERQVRVVKKFTLPKFEDLQGTDRLREEYLMHLEVSYTNTRADSQPVELPLHYVHAGSAAPVHQHDQPLYTGFNFFRGSSNKLVDLNWFKGGGFLFFKRGPRPVYPEQPEQLTDVRWAGVTSQYFTTLLTPQVDPKAMSDEQVRQRGVAVWARRFEIAPEVWRASGHALDEGGTPAGVEGALGMGAVKLAPGQTVTRTFGLYAGPREYSRLDALGNYEAEIMDFGIFGLVSKTLLNSMNFLNGLMNSYALAIIVLTLAIKSVLWPLQNKATASMKRMQALQPKMAELKAKYEKDPQTMNVEVMKLYKAHGVNPLGGCLPMLVQIPIFFGFYNMLGKAVELRNAKFLWVHDLSQPDTVAHLGSIPINVLPLLMAVTMFWSMLLQPKSGDQAQQRIFMFVPLIFIFFCYNFASALALYWTVQNIFSIVQLYATRNRPAPALVPVAAPKARR